MQPKPLERHKAYDFKTLSLPQKDGGGILIYFPDLPGCASHGETFGEAVKNGYDAVADWIEASEHWGHKIPEPSFKVIKTGRKIKFPDGSQVQLGQSSNKETTEAEKALAVDEAMKEFLGV